VDLSPKQVVFKLQILVQFFEIKIQQFFNTNGITGWKSGIFLSDFQGHPVEIFQGNDFVRVQGTAKNKSAAY
jgi:hypothetical protein